MLRVQQGLKVLQVRPERRDRPGPLAPQDRLAQLVRPQLSLAQLVRQVRQAHLEHLELMALRGLQVLQAPRGLLAQTAQTELQAQQAQLGLRERLALMVRQAQLVLQAQRVRRGQMALLVQQGLPERLGQTAPLGLQGQQVLLALMGLLVLQVLQVRHPQSLAPQGRLGLLVQHHPLLVLQDQLARLEPTAPQARQVLLALLARVSLQAGALTRFSIKMVRLLRPTIRSRPATTRVRLARLRSIVV